MRAMLTDNLEFDGYRVTAVASGEEALAEVERQAFALLLVDVMLPGISGFEVCERLRGRGTRVPIIMLTARTARARSRAGPRPRRRRLREQAVQRARAARARPRPGPTRRLAFARPARSSPSATSTVRLRQRLVTRKGRRVALSAREFELLRYLIAHRNEVVSREQLLRDVWGYHQLSVTRTVDNYIAKLRTQLEPKPHDPRYIVTVHGSGYQLLLS